jgi:hypothetical protein
MTKEYGKLTAEQFGALIAALPEVRSQASEFPTLVARVPNAKLASILTGGFNWADIYEYSFSEHVAIAVVAFNYAETLSSALASPDPQQHVLDRLYPADDDDSTHPAFEPQDLIGIAF